MATPQINDLIGLMGKSNRAAGVAHMVFTGVLKFSRWREMDMKVSQFRCGLSVLRFHLLNSLGHVRIHFSQNF